MTTPAKAAAICALAVSLAGCGGDDGAAKREAAPRISGIREGPLLPGRYATATFRPRLAVTLGEGWSGLGEAPDAVALTRGRAYLGFLRVERVIHPRADERPSGRPRPEDVEPAPADLAAWLRAHPRLEIEELGTVVLGTLEGIGVAVSARPDGRSNVVRLFLLADNSPFLLQEGDRARFLLVESGGARLVVSVEAPPDEFDEFAKVADDVLATAELR